MGPEAPIKMTKGRQKAMQDGVKELDKALWETRRFIRAGLPFQDVQDKLEETKRQAIAMLGIIASE